MPKIPNDFRLFLGLENIDPKERGDVIASVLMDLAEAFRGSGHFLEANLNNGSWGAAPVLYNHARIGCFELTNNSDHAGDSR